MHFTHPQTARQDPKSGLWRAFAPQSKENPS